MDCSAFLNWDEGKFDSVSEQAVVFRSLVATLKLQPSPDASLDVKAVKFLESVKPKNHESPDALLNSLASNSDASQTDFVQSIVVLISSASNTITVAAMKMLDSLILFCSPKIHLALVKADLIPQVINSLNLQSLSFAETVDLHTRLMSWIPNSFWLATPNCLAQLGLKDENEQQAVHETVLKQVVVPLEKYFHHLCVNRYSVVDGELSGCLLVLLTHLLRICPYYQPTMEFVLHMPAAVTIPSCLAFVENDVTIRSFLHLMNYIQLEWNDQRRDERQMWKKVHRMLRMEGIEDVMEVMLRNDQSKIDGRWIVAHSIDLNNEQGMNVPKLW